MSSDWHEKTFASTFLMLINHPADRYAGLCVLLELRRLILLFLFLNANNFVARAPSARSAVQSTRALLSVITQVQLLVTAL